MLLSWFMDTMMGSLDVSVSFNSVCCFHRTCMCWYSSVVYQILL
jgi:hypothetical protein